MKIQEGFAKAKVAGTEARNKVKASLPPAFRKVLYWIIGVWGAFWLSFRIGNGLSINKETSDKVAQKFPTSGETTNAVEQLSASGENTANHVAEQISTAGAAAGDDISAIFWLIGVAAVLVAAFYGHKFHMLRPLLIAAVVGVTSYVGIDYLGMDWSSYGFGQYLNQKVGAGTALLIPAFAGGLVGILTLFVLGPKKSDGNKPKTIVLLDFVTDAMIIGAFAFALWAVAVLLLNWFGPEGAAEVIIPGVEVSETPTPLKRGCVVREISLNMEVTKNGRDVKVCKDSGSFHMEVSPGYVLDRQLSPKWRKDVGEHLVARRIISDFFEVKPGTSENTYHFIPKTGKGSEWIDGGFEEVTIFVRARKK